MSPPCAGGTKVLSEGQLIDLWERIDARVGELLEGCEPLPAPPLTFNPASEIPIEEQKLVPLPSCVLYKHHEQRVGNIHL